MISRLAAVIGGVTRSAASGALGGRQMDPSLDNHTMRLFYYDLFYAFPAHPLPSYVQVDSSQILPYSVLAGLLEFRSTSEEDEGEELPRLQL